MPEGSEQYTPPEAEGKISLRHLLTYDNPRMAEYQRLISSEKRGGSCKGAQYAYLWHDILWHDKSNKIEYNPSGWEKARAYFREKLSDGILVDVGGGGIRGSWQSNVMRAFAKKFGVKTYINVDTSHWQKPNPYTAINVDTSHWQKPNPYTAYRAGGYDYLELPAEERTRQMEEYLVVADMLDFVARLSKNTANFTENGIDEIILGRSQEGHEYGKALFEEMVRATKVGGIIFGIGSKMFGRDNPQLKDVTEELGFSRDRLFLRHEIFEKIRE